MTDDRAGAATGSLDLDRLGDRPRIVVVVRDHMSGVLYSIPALRALRSRWPEAQITLLTSSYSAPILDEGSPYLDRVLPLFTFADEPGRFDRLIDLVRKARTWLSLVGRVDLVVHLRHVGGSSLAFAASLGRPPQVAFTQGGRFNRFLTLELGPEPIELGSRQRNQLIIEGMGIEPAGYDMELAVGDDDRRWAEQWLATRGHRPDDHLTIVHPGSHWGCNQWLPERWSETIDRLTDRHGGTVVITGVGRERPLADRIVAEAAPADASKGRVLTATGETTLGQYSALIGAADLVVAIDAAPTQVCQALDKPAVIMMGAGNPAWNGPVPGEPMVMLQEWDNDNPRPEICQWAAGACNGPQCSSRLEDITVEQVLRSVDEVLVGLPGSDDTA